MKIIKKISVILMVIIISSTLFSCSGKKWPATTGAGKTGLFVNNYGTIYLGENEFYGYGIVMFSTFITHLTYYGKTTKDNLNEDMLIADAYKADFEFCNEYDIPVVRIPFSTWDSNSYRIFEKDPDRFFGAMDDIVKEAEKANVGIIASLLWNQDALPYYVSERRASYGDTQSQITEFAKKYVSAIVERYKDSPAIWGWEIGNEYNLTADLNDPYMTDYQVGSSFVAFSQKSWLDYYSSAELQTFYTEIGNTINDIDPDRLITTGNGDNRSFSYASHQSSENMDEYHYWAIDWTTDTREQFIEMVNYYTPDPIDTICFHFQHASSGAKTATLSFTHTLKDETLDTAEYIKLYIEAGKKSNKAVYFGEFGDFLDYENLELVTLDEFKEAFTQLVDWMYEDDLQLATGWFNWSKARGDRFNHTLTNLSDVNKYKMEELKRINAQFIADGRQDTESYWSQYPCDGSSFSQ